MKVRYLLNIKGRNFWKSTTFKGFRYFLILFIGISLIIKGLTKRSGKVFALGIGMVAFSFFMFQDGSAEIVDHILKYLY